MTRLVSRRTAANEIPQIFQVPGRQGTGNVGKKKAEGSKPYPSLAFHERRMEETASIFSRTAANGPGKFSGWKKLRGAAFCNFRHRWRNCISTRRQFDVATRKSKFQGPSPLKPCPGRWARPSQAKNPMERFLGSISHNGGQGVNGLLSVFNNGFFSGGFEGLIRKFKSGWRILVIRDLLVLAKEVRPVGGGGQKTILAGGPREKNDFKPLL